MRNAVCPLANNVIRCYVATYFGLLMYFSLELSFKFCSSWPSWIAAG